MCVPQKILNHLEQDGGDVNTNTNAKNSDDDAEDNRRDNQTNSELG